MSCWEQFWDADEWSKLEYLGFVGVDDVDEGLDANMKL